MISTGNKDFKELPSYLMISCILLLLYWLWTRRHFYKFALKQPGFWGYPFVGCINRISRMQDPDLVSKVLISPNCLNKAPLAYQCLRHALTEGLITMPDEKWKLHRKLLNPSFRQQILQTFFGVFNQELKSILSDFRKLAETKLEFGAEKIMKQSALNAVLKTTMGHNLDNYDEVYNVSLVALDKGLGTAMNSISLNALKLPWLLRFHLGYQKIVRNMQSYGRNAIKARFERNTNKEGNCNINDLDDDVMYIKKPPRVFMDEAKHLYESKQLTLEEIAGHTHHITAAGFATVAYTTFNALLLLAMHPDKQERLFEEILEIAPEKTSEISMNELKSSPYLDMVINETLRLLPSVPIVARDCCADTKLNENITVPKGTQIFIDIFHLHRNKDIWGEDAEEFKPERFEPQLIKGLHPYAFIPFSKSTRDCIGKQYAIYFVKIMLIGLIRNFKFSTKFKLDNLKLMTTIHLDFKVMPGLRVEER